MQPKQCDAGALAPTEAATPEMPFAVAIGKPFQKQFGVCRSGQYSLISSNSVESYIIGEGRGRRYIVVRSFLDYVRRQQEREATARAQNNGGLGYGWLER